MRLARLRTIQGGRMREGQGGSRSTRTRDPASSFVPLKPMVIGGSRRVANVVLSDATIVKGGGNLAAHSGELVRLRTELLLFDRDDGRVGSHAVA